MNGEREKSEYEMKIRFDTILWNITSRKKERTPHFSWIFSSMLFSGSVRLLSLPFFRSDDEDLILFALTHSLFTISHPRLIAAL